MHFSAQHTSIIVVQPHHQPGLEHSSHADHHDAAKQANHTLDCHGRSSASISASNEIELQPLSRGLPPPSPPSSVSSSSISMANEYSHIHTPIHPRAPTANLVSTRVLVSLIGQVAICGAFQVWAFYYVRRQDWYEPPVIDPDNLNVYNPENSAVFYISSFQYIVGCITYSAGWPHRRRVYTNAWLMIAVAILSVFSLYALFAPSGFVIDLLGLVPFPQSFRIALFIAIILNTISCFVFESFLSKYVVRSVKGLQRLARRSRRNKTRKHGSKMYKAVERSMQHDGDA